MTANYFSMTFL